jgi:ankyrin repeat protein
MDDVRNGRRPEGSIMSGKTVDSLLPDEREAWRQLRKELESAGITPDLFTVHQSFITRTLRDAVNAGAFEAISEECENTSSDIPSRNSFSTSSRPHSFSALAQNETVIEEESASSLLTERDEQDTQFIFQVSGRADQSPSRRDLEDLKEPNIHVSAAEPIEQGEHIIGERSRRDSSDTSLGSNSVPLLARPPSRIDKPVTSGAGGAAVKQDKDAVPNGASQDDKRASHNDPGSPGPSKSTRHPVLSLRLETKPKLKSARPGRTTKLLNVVFRRDKGLLRAAIHGDNDRVLSLLEKGVDIGSMDDNFCTALHHASENGHKDLVKVLLERGASIEQRDNFGHSALARASQGGHIEVVKLLLDKGASINTQNRRGRTPLLTEKAGLDPLLLAASRAGRTKEVDFLLWKGANIESVDHLSKDTPLIVACRLGHSETVKVLLQKQATMESIGNGGGTALIAASRVGNTEVLTLLLRCGANTEARDMFGRTALWNASCMVHVKAAEMLLQNGAEVTTRDNDGRTALMAVTRSSTLRWGDATRLVEILLERGSDVNEKDRQGRTGLMHAAENRDWAQSAGVIPVLLENGARINDQDNDGKTALDLARESGNRWAAEDLSNYTNEYIKVQLRR